MASLPHLGYGEAVLTADFQSFTRYVINNLLMCLLNHLICNNIVKRVSSGNCTAGQIISIRTYFTVE